MSHELQGLYQIIQETPVLAIDFPKESAKGRVVRLDTGTFSLSSWEMEFHKDTFVEGNTPEEMRLLFCSGEGVEWVTNSGSMRLDHNEACFCLSEGSSERMCYQGGAPFSFLSVSFPVASFTRMIGSYIPDPDRIMSILPGKRFTIPSAVQKVIHDIGSLESIHGGFEMMCLDARLLESLALCLQSALHEPAKRHRLHHDDLMVIQAIGKKIGEDPSIVPDIATLAREYCMSVSKLTRSFRQVYGVSLHAFVIGARLQKGAELLLQCEKPVQEIAETLGYAKPSQFSADFRKQFGILPGEYRLR